MMSDSAWTAMLQLWPLLSSAVDIVAKPRPSAWSAASAVSRAVPAPVTPGAVPVWWSAPHEKPWVISSLWFHCRCGSQGAHGWFGWKSVAT